MKSIKKIVVLVILIGSSTQLTADDFGFRFGLNFSPNLSWFRTETAHYTNRGADLGFSYGLIVDYEFAQNYAIHSGLNILHTGGSIRYRNTTLPTNDKRWDYNLRYLEIPLALKLRTEEMGFFTYYGKFGLGLGFNLSAKAEKSISHEDGSTTRRPETDVSDEIRFLRGALILGAGLEYNLGGRTSLLAGITFHNGFSNVLDRGPIGSGESSPSAPNNYVELVLGVMF